MKKIIDNALQRKEYKAPMMEVFQMRNLELLTGSGVGNTDLGIGYGGVDESGDLEPSSRLLDEMLGDGNLFGF
ncbi:MAG: hypothetical protein IJ190_08325 [Prevotella sp.]|nr:hypothetical protein [Prevotella sp.]